MSFRLWTAGLHSSVAGSESQDHSNDPRRKGVTEVDHIT